MHPTKPAALRPGETVGIISPSWFGGASLRRRLERGIRQIEALGFRTRIGTHTLRNAGWVSASPEERVADLHDMFQDPEVRAIIATIGGDHACQLLPLIDWNLIRDNPKIFMGFSDITVLNVAIWAESGMVTFNGPSVMTDWAEYPAMPKYARESALAAITRPLPVGALRPARAWTEEFLDWETGEDETRPRVMTPSTGWTWLRHGQAEGRLIGGCLESLQHLRGTRWWPDFADAILFLETSEERPSPATVDGMLSDYENMGVFDWIREMVVARPYGYTDGDRHSLHAVIRERTARWALPVLADVDAGHTSPILMLPIGCLTGLDSERGLLEITEAAVT
ncbi:MAG TPA: S66 peptidase family protein [Thermomicrobiales bacterium]|nr:S66 peptidase family protein [Thermomicrobiales bacterium]